MAIEGILQPEMLQVEEGLRLRKFDGVYGFALAWYQDVETVYLVDGVREPYTQEKLKRMYEYLEERSELYFIEVQKGDGWIPIGDVAFQKEDMPIVIGESSSRGKGIGRKIIQRLMERGKELGYDSLSINEIYAFNAASIQCFESLGFRAYEQTAKGSRFARNLD